jgi:hypothetical protein
MNFQLNPKDRQHWLAIVAAVAVALWAGDRFVLEPLQTGWAKRKATIAELRQSVSQGAQLLARSGSIRTRWDSMQSNTLPQEASLAEGNVLKAFDRWSELSRVSITAIRPQWRRGAENHATLECRVDGYGSLATITRFLYEIENDPLALKVDTVELSARDNEGALLTLGLQVSGLLLSPPE